MSSHSASQGGGYPQGGPPVKNSPGQNQPGTPMTPEQRKIALQVVQRWTRIIENYVEALEADMDYIQSNQPGAPWGNKP